MDILFGRAKEGVVSGEIYVNGQRLQEVPFTAICGYVLVLLDGEYNMIAEETQVCAAGGQPVPGDDGEGAADVLRGASPARERQQEHEARESGGPDHRAEPAGHQEASHRFVSYIIHFLYYVALLLFY